MKKVHIIKQENKTADNFFECGLSFNGSLKTESIEKFRESFKKYPEFMCKKCAKRAGII